VFSANGAASLAGRRGDNSSNFKNRALKARFNATNTSCSHLVSRDHRYESRFQRFEFEMNESSPRRPANEGRAFGANRFVQVRTWTNVPGFSGRNPGDGIDNGRRRRRGN